KSSTGLVELPETVQSLLAARLDSLEPLERRLVQHAAVVGRTFWEGALAVAVPGEREYAFKHVLIRDVAYGMLPKSVRWRKHFEIGQFIEDRAGDRTEEVVPLLAEHYGRAASLSAEAGVENAEIE